MGLCPYQACYPGDEPEVLATLDDAGSGLLLAGDMIFAGRHLARVSKFGGPVQKLDRGSRGFGYPVRFGDDVVGTGGNLLVRTPLTGGEVVDLVPDGHPLADYWAHLWFSVHDGHAFVEALRYGSGGPGAVLRVDLVDGGAEVFFQKPTGTHGYGIFHGAGGLYVTPKVTATDPTGLYLIGPEGPSRPRTIVELPTEWIIHGETSNRLILHAAAGLMAVTKTDRKISTLWLRDIGLEPYLAALWAAGDRVVFAVHDPAHAGRVLVLRDSLDPSTLATALSPDPRWAGDVRAAQFDDTCVYALIGATTEEAPSPSGTRPQTVLVKAPLVAN